MEPNHDCFWQVGLFLQTMDESCVRRVRRSAPPSWQKYTTRYRSGILFGEWISAACAGVLGLCCVRPARRFPSFLSSMLAFEQSAHLSTLQNFVHPNGPGGVLSTGLSPARTSSNSPSFCPPTRNWRGVKHNIELGGGGGRGFLLRGRRFLFYENCSPNIVLLRYHKVVPYGTLARAPKMAGRMARLKAWILTDCSGLLCGTCVST